MNCVVEDLQADHLLHYQELLNAVMARMITGMEGLLINALSTND